MLDTFLKLPKPSTGSFSVEADTGRGWRVGRSSDGYPAILITFSSEEGESTPRRLAAISYTPPQTVDVLGADGELRADRLAILECRTTERVLWGYFFRFVAVLVGTTATSEAQLEIALDALVALFRALQQPGSRTVQGLWGELAIIAWASDPVEAISSWHSDPHLLHDFAAGGMRLEVKCTKQSLREHHFQLDQLSSPDQGTTVIASLLLDPADSGPTIQDLLCIIGERIGAAVEPRRRLETIVAQSLGDAWVQVEDMRFDFERARDSLRFYLASLLPTIPQPMPPQVKNVRFVLDLSASVPLDPSHARRLAPFFAAVLPQGAQT